MARWGQWIGGEGRRMRHVVVGGSGAGGGCPRGASQCAELIMNGPRLR